MDGVTQNNTGILVIGATNRPESLDPAFRRRFQKKIYIPLYLTTTRARHFPGRKWEILAAHCRRKTLQSWLGRPTVSRVVTLPTSYRWLSMSLSKKSPKHNTSKLFRYVPFRRSKKWRRWRPRLREYFSPAKSDGLNHVGMTIKMQWR
jgi:hypothetical protein